MRFYRASLNDLKESHDVTTDNKLRLQQFHDLETEANAAYNRVKDKADEPTHVVFGSSTKPPSVAVSVGVSDHLSLSWAVLLLLKVPSMMIYP